MQYFTYMPKGEKSRKRPIDKKAFEENGFITYKSSEYGAKVRPSYLEVQSRHDWTGAKAPEAILVQKKEGYPKAVKLLLKAPGSFYSFLGYNLVRDYCLSYDLTPNEGSVLMILSFHDVMFKQDLRYWAVNVTSTGRILFRLCTMGFVTPVKVPSSKNTYCKRNGYTLSTLGVNFVQGYDAWFESKMETVRKKLNGSDIDYQRSEWLQKQKKIEEQLKKDLWNARILKKKDQK